MIGHAYSRSEYDNCVYHRKFSDGSFVYLPLYIDDMLIVAHDISLINESKAPLNSEFEMKDLGRAKKILGMEIHRDRQAQKLILSQKNYINRVLQRFNIDKSKRVSTSLAPHFKMSSDLCSQSEEENEQMSHVPYLSAIFMYAVVCTRPDLGHFVSVVSRYKSNPGNEHWQAVKGIFRFLKGTVDIGLVFGRPKMTHSNMVGYVDSNYATDLDK